MDHQIGRLISALVEQKLMDNTVILFVSDHGEMLGDHLMFQKAKPYQGSVQVPMFLSGPERLIGKHRRVCGDLVELRDVMPTLLELAGAEIPATVDGESMLHTVDRAYLHGEHSLGMDSMHFIVTKTDKYVWYSQTGRELYFDLEADPHETHNAIGDPENADRIAYLRSCLIRELDGREEGYSDGTQLFVGKPPLTVLRNSLI
jgi:arylsulfatase A-like enzyme